MNSLSFVDSPISGGHFVSLEMREIFNFETFLKRCVEVEVALAEAESRHGIIPQSASDGIAGTGRTFKVDLERISRESATVGYPILPLIEQMAAAAGEAGSYLHWGATTQDIMDTATVLQVRDALDLIEGSIKRVIDALSKLAADHRRTVMAGRTHLQHALPITFGYKAAVWLSGFRRHLERIGQLRPRVLLVEFSGAVGTLASLGRSGLKVQAELANVLGLGVPAITWHSSRDALAETVQLLGLVTGSLAKIATDISIMMATELGEVSEPFVRHRGASSTMPQKRNPISCELILAGAKMVRQHAGLMLDAMAHDFERATGPWHLEWMAVPESFALTSGCLEQAEIVLSQLEVNSDRMARNLESSHGLIMAEAVMMALAPVTGRMAAHDLVYARCRDAVETRVTLLESLLKSEEVVGALGTEKLRELTDPSKYLGAAVEMIDGLLERSA